MSILKWKTNYNADSRIWSGMKKQWKNEDDTSLGKEIFKVLVKNPENIGQICYPSGREYKNKELLTLSIRVAQHFDTMNLKQCEIIGICASNSDYLAPLIFGCMFRGLAINTLDPSFDKGDIIHIYSQTRPRLVFCDANIYKKVRQSLDECNLNDTPIYVLKEEIEGVLHIKEFLKQSKNETEFRCDDLKWNVNQMAAVVCSSGTTGLLKGVCVSHMAFLNSELFNSGNRVFCFSSVYWISGLGTLLHATLNNCCRIISDQPFSPNDFLQIMQRFKPNEFLGTPNQLSNLLLQRSAELSKCDFRSLKICYVGGSAVSYEVYKRFTEFLPHGFVYVGYGMSEIGGLLACGIPTKAGNCGKVAPNIELKIISDSDEHLAPNEAGEICVRTPYPLIGYYGNPEGAMRYADGFLHTGDLGYIDDNGDVYIIDRIKDILKYNYFHIHPNEIENVIYELKDVLEVSVCGIPDEIYVDLPAALIVPVSDSCLTEDVVKGHVAKRMSNFKQLRGGVYFANDLPKTMSGKINRNKTKEICSKLYRARKN